MIFFENSNPLTKRYVMIFSLKSYCSGQAGVLHQLPLLTHCQISDQWMPTMWANIANYFITGVIFLWNTPQISCLFSIDCYHLFRWINHNIRIKASVCVNHVPMAVLRTVTPMMFLNLSDSETIWFQNYLILNLSHSKPISFWTNLITNLSESEPIWFWI